MTTHKPHPTRAAAAGYTFQLHTISPCRAQCSHTLVLCSLLPPPPPPLIRLTKNKLHRAHPSPHPFPPPPTTTTPTFPACFLISIINRGGGQPRCHNRSCQRCSSIPGLCSWAEGSPGPKGTLLLYGAGGEGGGWGSPFPPWDHQERQCPHSPSLWTGDGAPLSLPIDSSMGFRASPIGWTQTGGRPRCHRSPLTIGRGGGRKEGLLGWGGGGADVLTVSGSAEGKIPTKEGVQILWEIYWPRHI